MKCCGLLWLRRGASIREIDASFCGLTNATLTALPMLPALESLNLDGCQEVDDEAGRRKKKTIVYSMIYRCTDWFRRCNNLASLQVVFAILCERPGVALRPINPQQFLISKVSSFHLSSANQGLAAVAQRCRALRNFSIYWNVKAGRGFAIFPAGCAFESVALPQGHRSRSWQGLAGTAVRKAAGDCALREKHPLCQVMCSPPYIYQCWKNG